MALVQLRQRLGQRSEHLSPPGEKRSDGEDHRKMTTHNTSEENVVVRRFIQEVNELVPVQDRDVVFDALKRYKSSFDLQRLLQDLKTVLDEPNKLEVFEYIRPLIPAKHQREFDKLAPAPPGLKRRVINLRRRTNESLGFAVRGGFEHGIGVFVSHVEPGSQAEQRGLQVGDEIVRVNGFTIAQAIHEEVLNLIKGRDEVELKVTNIGMLPVKERQGDSLTWKYVEKPKRKRSSMKVPHHQTPEEDGEVVKLFANLRTSPSLGCSIMSGPHGKGIYIQRVGPGSLGEDIGLEVGDQILDVNGTSFLDVTHNEALVALKSSKELNITVRKKSGLHIMQSAASHSRMQPPKEPPKQKSPSPKHTSDEGPIYAVVNKEKKVVPDAAPPAPPPPPPPEPQAASVYVDPDRKKQKKQAPGPGKEGPPKLDFKEELMKVSLKHRMKEDKMAESNLEVGNTKGDPGEEITETDQENTNTKEAAGDEREATARLEKVLKEKLAQQRDERQRQEVSEDMRMKKHALEDKLLREIRRHQQEGERETEHLRLQRQLQDEMEMRREVDGSGSDILRGRGGPLRKPDIGLLGPGYTREDDDGEHSSNNKIEEEEESASNVKLDSPSPISDIDDFLQKETLDVETPSVVYVDRVESPIEQLPFTFID